MANMHPQTRAAWARAMAPPDPARAARVAAVRRNAEASARRWAGHWSTTEAWADGWPERCDAAGLAWLRSSAAIREFERNSAIVDEMRARESAVRLRAELARIEAERARLVGERSDVGDLEARGAAMARAWSETGPGSAWKLALHLVRGLTLDEGVALRIIQTEFAHRYHRALPLFELRGMVRRAGRATRTGYGWLLERRAG